MRFIIKHELPGRLRVRRAGGPFAFEEADRLAAYLSECPQVQKAKVYEATGDVVLCYSCPREDALKLLAVWGTAGGPALSQSAELSVRYSGRELNSRYREKLLGKVAWHFGKLLFLPAPVRFVIAAAGALRYFAAGVKTLFTRGLKVEVLDATAITVSMLRGDYSTASSVMFLLGIGELLEDWTHKKSVGDLARSMSLNVSKVWTVADGQEVLLPVSDVREGSEIIVRSGNLIPLDGVVVSGEAMVNQSSMTGEAVPVKKDTDSHVYAGTAVEEGELHILVQKAAGETRYERIVRMIEDSEKLKSSLEAKASSLADGLVPWSLGGTVLTWLLTGNSAKAISILMVDFSCALKLAMPLAVLSAIREANDRKITVKGGKYLELLSQVDTVVFDKTGTLTKSQPTLTKIVLLGKHSEEDVLRAAACLEEHFPHSVANAVVRAAAERGLTHEEFHSEVEYIVAHGIASRINGERIIIGSWHFVFEDEHCRLTKKVREALDTLPSDCSFLYMAVSGRLEAILCIRDPLRKEAPEVIRRLHEAGIPNLVMMTGDSERTASVIAAEVGVDAYRSEVLPEDKAAFVNEEKARGRKVAMLGDGINDSPALSAADVGIAMGEGAQIAREVADITLSVDDLSGLLEARELSELLMRRIRTNYRFIISFNLGLIALGVLGVLTPAASALLHNGSTIAIGLKSMTDLMPERSAGRDVPDPAPVPVPGS